MTEVDIAMASLEVATRQAWVTAAGVIGSFVVGLTQCGLIWAGLRQMRTASAARDRQLDNQHAEAMTALTALIERTAPGSAGKEPA